MKRRKQYRRTQGHRQYLTQLICTAIDNGAGQKTDLSAADRKEKLSKFQSHLAPKGEAFTLKKAYIPKKKAAAAGVKLTSRKAK